MSERAWDFYINDMIGFSENVMLYTDGLDQVSFETSRLNYDATLRNLELIGEAASISPIIYVTVIRQSRGDKSLRLGIN